MRRRGFTLVEVLVAVVIMAVVAAMGWQGVSGMVRARDIGTAASDRTLRLSAVVGQWEQDLAAVYDSPNVPGISFDGAGLRLVRRSDNGVQVVVWALRDGAWRRWAGPPTQRADALRESWMASQQLQGNPPGELRLFDGVTGWQVYFWRGQGWSNAQSSADQVAVADPAVGGNALAGSGNLQPGGANAQAGGANAQAGGGTPQNSGGNQPGGTGTPAPTAQRTRTLLPTGVRLQIDLPEGRLQRDVMLAPSS